MTTTKTPTKRQSGQHVESWMNRYWRPACAVTYLVICLFDFLVAPLLFGIYSFHFQDHMVQSWVPLTLQNGGLFHASFAAILSVAGWGHSKEKVSQIENTPVTPIEPIKRL